MRENGEGRGVKWLGMEGVLGYVDGGRMCKGEVENGRGEKKEGEGERGGGGGWIEGEGENV